MPSDVCPDRSSISRGCVIRSRRCSTILPNGWRSISAWSANAARYGTETSRSRKRDRIRKSPPACLLTTPESLEVLLISQNPASEWIPQASLFLFCSRPHLARKSRARQRPAPIWTTPEACGKRWRCLQNTVIPARFLHKDLLLRERGGGGNRTREWGFCRPRPYHLATPPRKGTRFVTEMRVAVNGQSCAQFSSTIGAGTSCTPAGTSGVPSVWSSAVTRLFSNVTANFPAGTFT